MNLQEEIDMIRKMCDDIRKSYGYEDSNSVQETDAYYSPKLGGCYDDDDEIQVIVNLEDIYSMSEEERNNYRRKFSTCNFCQSMGRSQAQYTGHSVEDCKFLANIRCNYCAQRGHTGGKCPDRRPDSRPLTIRCMNCFRSHKPEKFYMSHTIDRCRYKGEQEDTKSNTQSSRSSSPSSVASCEHFEKRAPPQPTINIHATTIALLKQMQLRNKEMLEKLNNQPQTNYKPRR